MPFHVIQSHDYGTGKILLFSHMGCNGAPQWTGDYAEAYHFSVLGEAHNVLLQVCEHDMSGTFITPYVVSFETGKH